MFRQLKATQQITYQEAHIKGRENVVNNSPLTVVSDAMAQKSLEALEMSTFDSDSKVEIVAILTTKDIFTERGNFGVHDTNNFSISQGDTTKAELICQGSSSIVEVNKDSVFQGNPVRTELTRRNSFGINGLNNYSFFQASSDKSTDAASSAVVKPLESLSYQKVLDRAPQLFVHCSLECGAQEDSSLSFLQL